VKGVLGMLRGLRRKVTLEGVEAVEELAEFGVEEEEELEED
jgi:hypothetical protein